MNCIKFSMGKKGEEKKRRRNVWETVPFHQIQHGQEADDWKPMKTIGAGVNEIRIRDDTGAFRILYVAKFAEAVYVLHCFQKKTQQTSKPDIQLAQTRYKDLLKERTA